MGTGDVLGSGKGIGESGMQRSKSAEQEILSNSDIAFMRMMGAIAQQLLTRYTSFPAHIPKSLA